MSVLLLLISIHNTGDVKQPQLFGDFSAAVKRVCDLSDTYEGDLSVCLLLTAALY